MIVTRAIVDSDRDACIYVEAGAMKHNRYIDDVWELFLHKTEGDLIGAFVDDKLYGMGKLTRLYGDYGWLETLRVHPDYQNMGVGQEIYKAYFKHIKELNLKSIGMYTEMYNKISRYIAEKNNLTIRAYYTELLKEIEKIPEFKNSFKLIEKADGERLLSPYYGEMGKYIVINRTFYPVGKGLGEFLAENKYFYMDDDNNILIGGYRFQKEKAFHIPFIKGDIDYIIKYANYLGNKSNSKNLSMLKEKDGEEIELFNNKGFTIDGNYMTLWIEL